jgi:hypothetical protein
MENVRMGFNNARYLFSEYKLRKEENSYSAIVLKTVKFSATTAG